MIGSRVPAPLKRVLDAFPLVTLPAYSVDHLVTENVDEQKGGDELYVYSRDVEGFPCEPQSLFFFAMSLCASKQTKTIERSPYMSLLQQLPLLYTSSGAVVSNTDELLQAYFPDLVADNNLQIYRPLVETWLHDAWVASVLEAGEETHRHLYGYAAEKEPPYPFSVIVERQRRGHIVSKQKNPEDGPEKATVALETLEQLLGDNPLFNVGSLDNLSVFDILVYSYISPLLKYLPDSSLAAQVGPQLRSHAAHVHDKLSTLISSA